MGSGWAASIASLGLGTLPGAGLRNLTVSCAMGTMTSTAFGPIRFIFDPLLIAWMASRSASICLNRFSTAGSVLPRHGHGKLERQRGREEWNMREGAGRVTPQGFDSLQVP